MCLSYLKKLLKPTKSYIPQPETVYEMEGDAMLHELRLLWGSSYWYPMQRLYRIPTLESFQKMLDYILVNNDMRWGTCADKAWALLGEFSKGQWSSTARGLVIFGQPTNHAAVWIVAVKNSIPQLSGFQHVHYEALDYWIIDTSDYKIKAKPEDWPVALLL